jgi:hypothetical protein
LNIYVVLLEGHIIHVEESLVYRAESPCLQFAGRKDRIRTNNNYNNYNNIKTTAVKITTRQKRVAPGKPDSI